MQVQPLGSETCAEALRVYFALQETGDIYFSDSVSFGPALGAEAYYDTMWAYLMNACQVQAAARSCKAQLQPPQCGFL